MFSNSVGDFMNFPIGQMTKIKPKEWNDKRGKIQEARREFDSP